MQLFSDNEKERRVDFRPFTNGARSSITALSSRGNDQGMIRDTEISSSSSLLKVVGDSNVAYSSSGMVSDKRRKLDP